MTDRARVVGLNESPVVLRYKTSKVVTWLGNAENYLREGFTIDWADTDKQREEERRLRAGPVITDHTAPGVLGMSA